MSMAKHSMEITIYRSVFLCNSVEMSDFGNGAEDEHGRTGGGGSRASAWFMVFFWGDLPG